MKYGPRTEGHSRLSLRPPTSLPFHMRKRVVELYGLETDPDYRRRGDATELMLTVCVEADMNKTFLFLAVVSNGGMEQADLAAWYARFGFLPIQAKPLLMTRPYAGASNGPR
jgi:N-acetylglutamate synthase-like GNAT family acetyltransferase